MSRNINALFQQLHPVVLRYANGLTKDSDVAEDVTQEAFCRLLRHDIPEHEARPWLITVTRNLVGDRARRLEARRRLSGHFEGLVSAGLLPDEEYESSEAVAAVRQALAQLAPRDQKMLLMREEGFKYAEIGETLGVATASVGTLIARALRRFAEVYHPSGTNRAA